MKFFEDITFAHPGLLWLLLVIPLLVTFYIFRNNDAVADVLIPLPWRPGNIPKTNNYKNYLRHLLFAFRMLVAGLLIVIIARRQSRLNYKNITSEGIDIIIALDISGSMLPKDFNPTRIDAAKK